MDQLGFEIKHLKSISTMAVKSSFADPETKLHLLSKISQS
jgi:adenosine deaminase